MSFRPVFAAATTQTYVTCGWVGDDGASSPRLSLGRYRPCL